MLTTDAVEASDVVITMGCGDACPIFPGKRYLDWALDDPAGQGIDAVRPIRDEIERRIRGLLAELDVPVSDRSRLSTKKNGVGQSAQVHEAEHGVVQHAPEDVDDRQSVVDHGRRLHAAVLDRPQPGPRSRRAQHAAGRRGTPSAPAGCGQRRPIPGGRPTGTSAGSTGRGPPRGSPNSSGWTLSASRNSLPYQP